MTLMALGASVCGAQWKATAIFWQAGEFLRRRNFTPSLWKERCKKNNQVLLFFLPLSPLLISLFSFLVGYRMLGEPARDQRAWMWSAIDPVSRRRKWEELQRRELMPPPAEESGRWISNKERRALKRRLWEGERWVPPVWRTNRKD